MRTYPACILYTANCTQPTVRSQLHTANGTQPTVHRQPYTARHTDFTPALCFHCASSLLVLTGGVCFGILLLHVASACCFSIFSPTASFSISSNRVEHDAQLVDPASQNLRPSACARCRRPPRTWSFCSRRPCGAASPAPSPGVC